MAIPVHGKDSTIPRLQEECTGAGPGEDQHPLKFLPRSSFCQHVEPVAGLLTLPVTLLHTTYEKPCVLIMRSAGNDDFLSSGLGTGILSEIASHVLLIPRSFTSSQTHHAKLPGHQSLYSSLGYRYYFSIDFVYL